MEQDGLWFRDWWNAENKITWKLREENGVEHDID